MASLNKVFLMGNLTRDPELRYAPSGTPVASFGLATNRLYTAPNGEKKEEVCFVNVVVWRSQAENCSQYLNKGSLCLVEGRLIYRTWEQEKVKRSTLEVRADRVQFLGKRQEPSQTLEVEEEERVPSKGEGEPYAESLPEPSKEGEVPF